MSQENARLLVQSLIRAHHIETADEAVHALIAFEEEMGQGMHEEVRTQLTVALIDSGSLTTVEDVNASLRKMGEVLNSFGHVRVMERRSY